MGSGLTLTSDMLLVLGLVVFTLVMFTLDWIRADVVALLILVVLGITSEVPAERLFGGFAGNAVMAIMATMIMGAGLDRTGMLGGAAGWMLQLAKGDERRLLLILCTITGLISAVMQNPAVAALFLPVVSRISTRTGVPISRLLMPMACCIILGGTMTMVGNSPQILLNDLIASVNRNLPSGADTLSLIGMFGISPIGLALWLMGLAYFYRFWPKLQAPTTDEGLSVNPATTEGYFEQVYGIAGELRELGVTADSDFAGRNILDLESLPGSPLILALKSGDEARLAPPADQPVGVGDVLGVLGQHGLIMDWAQSHRLQPASPTQHLASLFAPTHAGVCEAVVPPTSRFIGQNVGLLRLRKRFGISVLALGRSGKIFRQDLRSHDIRAGDILVLHGAWRDVSHAAEDRDFVVVTDYPKVEERPHRLAHAGVSFALAMVLALLTDLPLPVALWSGAVGMLVMGVLTMDEAIRAINWKTIFLMAALIPLGWAMDASGAAAWIAQEILLWMGDVPVWLLQLAVAVLTTLFSQVMSNVGATVVMVPMAVNIALAAHTNPTVFALIVVLSASNNFTSLANPVLSLVAGPANYRGRDLIRTGAPLSALYVLVMLVMVNIVF